VRGHGRLAGRRAECAALDGLLDAVRAGQSRALVVHGEPGAGKTVLLEYPAGRVASCQVVRAAGVQSEMELAFAGLHQVRAPLLDAGLLSFRKLKNILQFAETSLSSSAGCARRALRGRLRLPGGEFDGLLVVAGAEDVAPEPVVEVADVEAGEPAGPVGAVLAHERHVVHAAEDDAAGGLGEEHGRRVRRW
jgi:hypothetical protein